MIYLFHIKESLFLYEKTVVSYKMENIFKFDYGCRDMYFGSNSYARSLFCDNDDREIGKIYLKCTYQIKFDLHDGYCSDHDPDYDDNSDDDNDYKTKYKRKYQKEKIKTVMFYFSIPEKLMKENNIDGSYFDDDWNLLRNDDTEEFFITWKCNSVCYDEFGTTGSEYCKYKDDYIPISIECVTIT